MKKRMNKRLAICLLTFAMMIVLLPVTVMTVYADKTGDCGYNCKWTVSGSTITFQFKTAYLDTSKNVTGEITSGLTASDKAGITKAVFSTAIAGIGEKTLQGFTNLETVTISSTVCKTIEKKAFYDLEKLETVDLGKSLTTIGEEAFRLCKKLKKLTIPDTVQTIETGAFWSSGLEEIKLSANLKYLGEHAFQAAKSLKKISIPDKLEKIPDSCFTSCEYLATADLGSGVKEIGTGAFNFCSNLTQVKIPAATKTIGASAFNECKKLKSLDLSHVTSIGQIAVNRCLALSEIKLSNKLTTFKNNSFLNNYTAKKVIFDGTEEEFAKIANKSESKNSDLLTGTVEFLQSSSVLPKVKDTEKVILSLSGMTDVRGAVFNVLRARAEKTRKTGIQLKWRSVSGASGYLIYGGLRNGAFKKLENVKGANKISYSANGLSKNKYYKFIVVAYQNVGKGAEDLRVLSCSPTIIAATLGGKYRNTSAVKIPAKKITLKKGKKQKLNVSVGSP